MLRSTIGLPDLEQIFLTQSSTPTITSACRGCWKTFALCQRELPLTIYGPAGLRDLYKSLGRIVGKLSYPVELEEVRPGEALERDGYRILVFPVHHGVSAVGYAVAEHERPGRVPTSRPRTPSASRSVPERGAL